MSNPIANATSIVVILVTIVHIAIVTVITTTVAVIITLPTTIATNTNLAANRDCRVQSSYERYLQPE